MNSERSIIKYGLIAIDIVEIDLKLSYFQQTPNRPMDKFFQNNLMLAINSPHFIFSRNLFLMGEKWVRRNYKKTIYYKMMSFMGKKKYPLKFERLFKSIRKMGYLKGKYKNNYIVVLMTPFASSRYGRKVKNNIPEIWSGHHRASILLSIGIDVAKVMVAKDINAGTKRSFGKIHGMCKV